MKDFRVYLGKDPRLIGVINIFPHGSEVIQAIQAKPLGNARHTPIAWHFNAFMVQAKQLIGILMSGEGHLTPIPIPSIGCLRAAKRVLEEGLLKPFFIDNFYLKN